jgi:hypothetical protein
LGKRPKLRNMEMRFSTWNIKFIQGMLPNDSIERTGQMQVKFSVTAGGQIGRRWERSAGECTLPTERRMAIMN